MDDDGGEIKEDWRGMWLSLACLAAQFQHDPAHVPIINNLIINSLFPNDRISNIIHLNAALELLPAVNWGKCIEIQTAGDLLGNMTQKETEAVLMF